MPKERRKYWQIRRDEGRRPMDAATLRTALTALRFLDRDALEKAGLLRSADGRTWKAFQADPGGFFLDSSTEEQERFAALVSGGAA